MKKIFLLTFSIVFSEHLLAQQNFNCISHEVFSKQMIDNKEFKKNQAQLEKETEAFLQNTARTNAATYIIPIVFHVIHTGGAGNISDAQIIDQVNILNKEFNRQQADTILTPTAFLPLTAKFNVEFRLAKIDPTGNCTNGIDRVYSSLATCSYQWDAVKAVSYWPSNKYLNIWLIESMRYPGTPGCNGGGYSAFPGGAPNLDGIVMRSDLIGSIGTAQTTTWGNWRGRYLIHELGHWFNLRHIWGDANCGDDFISDTPPHVFSNSGCPNFPHRANNSCGSNSNGEMYTNYMDYTDGTCLNMFSAGQVAVMTAAINSNVSSRNNLWSSTNLIATGIADPYIYPPSCLANPAILPFTTTVVCLSDSVRLIDYSSGGLSTSRTWSVPGGSASGLGDSIIKVKYNSPGLYNVSLTKNYLSNTKTTVFNDRILVMDDAANSNYIFPIYDSFEDSTAFKRDWINLSRDNDGNKWQLTNSTSYFGDYCVGIRNFNQVAPLIDELISPTYDLTYTDSVKLNFKLHFAGRISENFDRLQILISNNCGKKWNSIYSKTAAGVGPLKTVPGFVTSSFTPAVTSDEWRNEEVIIPNNWSNGKVNFRFVFTSGSGNNIFIDDLNITGKNTVGIKENTVDNLFSVFPNPATNFIHVKNTHQVILTEKIFISDILGKVCIEKTIHKKEPLTVDISHLKNGVYFITIQDNKGVIYNSKFIKQASE